MTRVQCNYKPENSRFLLECDFSKQYNHYYRKRFEKTKPFLEFNCRQKWDPTLTIYNLAEMTGHAECIVIGTIFKRMKQQPDVVEEVSKGDFNVKCERYQGRYSSPEDTLVLEDTEESVELVGKINPKNFVTGIVVALLGVPINDGGKFLVKDVCFAEPNRQIIYQKNLANGHPEKPLELEDTKPLYLMVVSSLGFQRDLASRKSHTEALQNMIDFLYGEGNYFGDEKSSLIGRVLVVGDSLHENRFAPAVDGGGDSTENEEPKTARQQTNERKQYSTSVRAANIMDDFFAQLSKTVNMEVMPGPSDPSSFLMPQQPFHPCMFPKSSMYPTFNCTTNPHRAIYDDKVEILATSGQNIETISRFSGMTDPLEIMKNNLAWGNSAPSAPDNLYSAPYELEDPFIIDYIPDVYIAGCQESYNTDYYEYKTADQENLPAKQRTLLVTIPKFCDTFSCVLIDLKRIQAELVSFQ